MLGFPDTKQINGQVESYTLSCAPNKSGSAVRCAGVGVGGCPLESWSAKALVRTWCWIPAGTVLGSRSRQGQDLGKGPAGRMARPSPGRRPAWFRHGELRRSGGTVNGAGPCRVLEGGSEFGLFLHIQQEVKQGCDMTARFRFVVPLQLQGGDCAGAGSSGRRGPSERW